MGLRAHCVLTCGPLISDVRDLMSPDRRPALNCVPGCHTSPGSVAKMGLRAHCALTCGLKPLALGVSSLSRGSECFGRNCSWLVRYSPSQAQSQGLLLQPVSPCRFQVTATRSTAATHRAAH